MSFITRFPVRFGDEDHAGVVYFPRFLDFFHRTFEDFFNELGPGYRALIHEDRTGFPAVRVEVDYHAPLRFGDSFEIELSTEHIGTKSASFLYQGRCEGRDIARAVITVACIDMDSFRAKPLPETCRELFEQHRTLPAAPPTEG